MTKEDYCEHFNDKIPLYSPPISPGPICSETVSPARDNFLSATSWSEWLYTVSRSVEKLRPFRYRRPILTTTKRSTRVLSRTEWLNGLRGLASFAVYVWHSSWEWQDFGLVDMPLPYDAAAGNADWYRLPFVRLLYAS